MAYVYKITHPLSERVYFGSSKEGERFRKHLNALAGKVHANIRLQRFFDNLNSRCLESKHYGFVFEKLFEGNLIECRNVEHNLIIETSFEKLFNISIITLKGDTTNHPDNKEVVINRKNKQSNAAKGENNSMYGRQHTDKTKNLMSASHTGSNHHFYGKSLSEKHRQKISDSHGRKRALKINGVRYEHAGAAALDLGLSRSLIRKRLNEKQNGFEWIS